MGQSSFQQMNRLGKEWKIINSEDEVYENARDHWFVLCLEGMKRGGNRMEIEVKIISIVWKTNENSDGVNNALKMRVAPHKNFHPKSGVKTG